jgi:hypothetical protein
MGRQEAALWRFLFICCVFPLGFFGKWEIIGRDVVPALLALGIGGQGKTSREATGVAGGVWIGRVPSECPPIALTVLRGRAIEWAKAQRGMARAGYP